MPIEDVVKGNSVTNVYWSLDEFAEAAERRLPMGPGANGRRDRCWMSDVEWRGATFYEACQLARTGWTEKLDETLLIAESAVEMSVKLGEMQAFTPVWDVTGAEVDIGRYLSGIPEDMIDYPPIITSKVGKVITLCVGGFYSSAVSGASLERRGQVIAALAMALTRMGHATEIWVDVAGHGSGRWPKDGHIKILVKGANDTVDPAKIMFGLAHRSMFRNLAFAVTHGWPSDFRSSLLIGRGYMHLGKVDRDLPGGTIYLEGVESSYDVPDAHDELRKHLGELGLLQEG
jgi:hypothetical protein